MCIRHFSGAKSLMASSPSIETPEVGFFGRDELPPISTARVTEEQIQQFFDYLESIPEATKFD